VTDLPASREMAETVIYSVDDYYTVQMVTPSSGRVTAQLSIPATLSFIIIIITFTLRHGEAAE